MRLIEIAPLPQKERKPSAQDRRIQNVLSEIADLQLDLESAHDELDRLESEEDTWPDWMTLLAIYGAPGNWPVVAG